MLVVKLITLVRLVLTIRDQSPLSLSTDSCQLQTTHAKSSPFAVSPSATAAATATAICPDGPARLELAGVQ